MVYTYMSLWEPIIVFWIAKYNSLSISNLIVFLKDDFPVALHPDYPTSLILY
jgi:hypothetical protein